MTRFVAALLIARGRAVVARVDPDTPRAAELGPGRSAALLIRAFRDGRKQRQADDDLTAELAGAMREVPGEHLARDAGREAWQAHRQQQEGTP